jgi:hypothetical protein
MFITKLAYPKPCPTPVGCGGMGLGLCFNRHRGLFLSSALIHLPKQTKLRAA